MQEITVLGTLPQWGMFVTLVVAVLGAWINYRRQNFDFTAAARKAYEDRIKELERKVEDCEGREADRTQEIKQLHEEMFGLRKQHIQEQISFAQAIISSLGRESPQLSMLLSALENGHRSLEAQRQAAEARVHKLTGVVGDSKGDTP